MDYEIVTLEEKIIVGFTAHTANSDPKMGEVIGGLWKRLFEGGTFFTMKNKKNNYSIGLYSGYTEAPMSSTQPSKDSKDSDLDYDITVGCEVNSVEDIPTDMVSRTIPAGKYAKFVIFGDMMEAVGKFWQDVWAIPLNRAFTGDFEEYVSTEESGEAEIHIYIAIAS